MKYIKNIAFNEKTDLKKIKAVLQKKLTSFPESCPPGNCDFLRVYFLSYANDPIVVFDQVPYDLFIKIFYARKVEFNDETEHNLVRIAAFENDHCTFIDWIAIPSVILAAILLSEYCVTDLQGFLNHGLHNFSNAYLSKIQKE